MDLGKNLRRLREAKRLTQEEAAARLGVATNTLARWERGELTPRPDRWEAIAAAFGRSLAALLR